MANDEKNWDPEDEIDPAKLQKEHLELGKEILEHMKSEKAAAEKRKLEYEAAGPHRGIPVQEYIPPTFQEVSGVMKRAWLEVAAIMPTAGDRVQAHAFMALVQAAAPPPKFGSLE